MRTPSAAPAPQSSTLSASSVRRSAPAPAPSAARIASSPSRRTERARIRLATFEHAITKTSADAASSTRRTVRAGEVIWSRRRTASMRKSAFFGYDSRCSVTIAVWAARSSARTASRSAPAAMRAKRSVMRWTRPSTIVAERWCGLVTTFAMISVCAGYGTDGSTTPTIVAERSPSLMVLPMRSGSLPNAVVQKRWVSTAAPAACGPSSVASRSRPRTGRSPITSK